MVIHLTKQGRKYRAFCRITIAEHLLTIETGKGDKIASSSTKHCGTFAGAVAQGEAYAAVLQGKGYAIGQALKLHDLAAFDKAKWHYEGSFPDDLPRAHAFIPTGFYLGWLIAHNLISEQFRVAAKEPIHRFHERRLTAPQLYATYLDGVFSAEEVNPEGEAFTRAYFDSEKSYYFRDVAHDVAASLPSIFHMQDTWENFDSVSALVTARYVAWRKATAS